MKGEAKIHGFPAPPRSESGSRLGETNGRFCMERMNGALAETKNDFSKGSVARCIMSLAVPMTAAQLINVLYSVVDRMYIGHLPEASTLALTGIGLTFPIISIISAFTQLFGMGGAPLCSIARGGRQS